MRQNALPDVGSSHARSKFTPSSAWIARSASCAAANCSGVTPTKPLWLPNKLLDRYRPP